MRGWVPTVLVVLLTLSGSASAAYLDSSLNENGGEMYRYLVAWTRGEGADEPLPLMKTSPEDAPHAFLTNETRLVLEGRIVKGGCSFYLGVHSGLRDDWTRAAVPMTEKQCGELNDVLRERGPGAGRVPFALSLQFTIDPRGCIEPSRVVGATFAYGNSSGALPPLALPGEACGNPLLLARDVLVPLLPASLRSAASTLAERTPLRPITGSLEASGSVPDAEDPGFAYGGVSASPRLHHATATTSETGTLRVGPSSLTLRPFTPARNDLDIAPAGSSRAPGLSGSAGASPAPPAGARTAHSPSDDETSSTAPPVGRSEPLRAAARHGSTIATPSVEGALQVAASVAALALLGAALAVAAFSRIGASRELDHGTRQRIYDLLQADPGRTAQEIATRLDLGLVNTRYHLRRMEGGGLIAGRRVRRRVRFYVPGVKVDLAAVEATATPVAQRIVETATASPGISLAEIARRVDVAPPLAHYHVRRLVAASLLVAEGEGRRRVYRPALRDGASATTPSA